MVATLPPLRALCRVLAPDDVEFSREVLIVAERWRWRTLVDALITRKLAADIAENADPERDILRPLLRLKNKPAGLGVAWLGILSADVPTPIYLHRLGAQALRAGSALVAIKCDEHIYSLTFVPEAQVFQAQKMAVLARGRLDLYSSAGIPGETRMLNKMADAAERGTDVENKTFLKGTGKTTQVVSYGSGGNALILNVFSGVIGRSGKTKSLRFETASACRAALKREVVASLRAGWQLVPHADYVALDLAAKKKKFSPTIYGKK